MGDIYAIAGGKGGVGKTSTTINAGIALQENGYETIVVDGDLGMTNLGGMLGIDHQPTVHDVLSGVAPLSEAITEGPAGVTVLPGSGRLEAFASADPANLGPVVDELRGAYDAILLDTGSGLCQETVVPMRLADKAIVTTTPEPVAITDAKKMIELGEHVDTGIVGAVVTRAEPETEVPEISDDLGVTVLSAVPEDPTAAANEPVVLHSPDTLAAQSYRTLAKKLGTLVSAQRSRA
jgi:septum site-determining protein MinD